MHHWYEEAILLDPTSITEDVFARMVPQCLNPREWADIIGPMLIIEGIESNNEIALFIAQAGHESASFRALTESMNYSTEALLKVFGRHRISKQAAEQYGRGPGRSANREAIANTIYGGEWGAKNLGNKHWGDGFRFRGRGIFQLTGRYNYERCAQETGLPLVSNPELLSQDKEAAAVSAFWFWNNNVTGKDVKTTTKQINGGFNGLADRVERFKRAISVLEAL